MSLSGRSASWRARPGLRASDNAAFAASPIVTYAFEVNGRERRAEFRIPQKPKGGTESGGKIRGNFDPGTPNRSALRGLSDRRKSSATSIGACAPRSGGRSNSPEENMRTEYPLTVSRRLNRWKDGYIA